MTPDVSTFTIYSIEKWRRTFNIFTKYSGECMINNNTILEPNSIRIEKDQKKPAIANPLPQKRRIYYVDSNGCVYFELSKALSTKESNTHNP